MSPILNRLPSNFLHVQIMPLPLTTQSFERGCALLVEERRGACQGPRLFIEPQRCINFSTLRSWLSEYTIPGPPGHTGDVCGEDQNVTLAS